MQVAAQREEAAKKKALPDGPEADGAAPGKVAEKKPQV